MSAAPFEPLDSSPHWPYLAASAVLTTFAAERLRPVGTDRSDLGRVAAMLVEHAEPVKAGPARGRWRLRDDVRRQVLAALGTPERIRSALDANAQDRPDDPTYRALAEMVTRSTPPKLAGRSLQDLLGIDRAVEWLEAANVPPRLARADIRGWILREKLLEPLRRLVVGFEGRQDDLTELRKYVDDLPSESTIESVNRFSQRLIHVFRAQPPLVIHGPGGAGKSTLVAKFILDHADAQRGPGIVFVLLDFDRSTLDPTRPDTLLAEVAGQLQVQVPAHASRLADIQEQIEQRMAGEDSVQSERSSHFGDSQQVRRALASVMKSIAGQSNRNLLFVVDTFEIVQRRGSTAVYSLLDLTATLLALVRRLRIVLVGRGELRREDFGFTDELPSWKSLPLRGFDEAAGRAYLRARLKPFTLVPVSDADLDRLVLQVRGNPLGLRLAAQVFAREGVAGVEDAIGRQRLNEAIAEEQLQGLLHARIVEHLDNEDLKKIANPGLIVRRITEDVIRDVLAGPCGLDLTQATPAALLAALRQEVSLVEPVDDDTLRHRPDVRLIMLPALRRDLGSLASRIDDAAVTYWQKRTGPAARAEEIYHRLWRGDSTSDLDFRWMPEAGSFLEDALDEFRSIAPDDLSRIWLSQKMGRELSDEIRQRADQLAWERDVERKARTLLSDGKTDQVLRVIYERPVEARVAASRLWVLEIDVRLLRGEIAHASEILAEAMRRLGDTIDADHTLALLARRAAIEERLDQLEAARLTAVEALALARTMRDRAAIFACGVTLGRLARKTGHLDDPEISALVSELSALATDDAVRRALEERPSLLREAAAELGPQAPALIADALERLGVEAEGVGLLSEALPESLSTLLKSLETPQRLAGTPLGRRDLATLIAANVRAGRLTPDLLRAVANLYASAVERLNKQVL